MELVVGTCSSCYLLLLIVVLYVNNIICSSNLNGVRYIFTEAEGNSIAIHFILWLWAVGGWINKHLVINKKDSKVSSSFFFFSSLYCSTQTDLWWICKSPCILWAEYFACMLIIIRHSFQISSELSSCPLNPFLVSHWLSYSLLFSNPHPLLIDWIYKERFSFRELKLWQPTDWLQIFLLVISFHLEISFGEMRWCMIE